MAELRRLKMEEGAGAADRLHGQGGGLSLRQALFAKKAAEQKKEAAEKAKGLKGKIEEKVFSPAKQATSNLLRWAWMTLIPSFGLTLIYINLHVFLKAVLGEKLFCKLGEEWLPKQVGTAAGEAGKTVSRAAGIIEAMGLVFLDIVFGFILFAALGLLVMVVSFMGAPFWEKLVYLAQAVMVLGWQGIESLIDLFSS